MYVFLGRASYKIPSVHLSIPLVEACDYVLALRMSGKELKTKSGSKAVNWR